MSYLYKMMVLMLIGGCGRTQAGDPGTSLTGTDTATLESWCYDDVVGEGLCGLIPYHCLLDCAATASPGLDGEIACATFCGGVFSACALVVIECWNEWTNPQPDDIGQPENEGDDNPACMPRWNCSDWNACTCLGFHGRTCVDLNGCEGTPAVGATAIIQTEGCNTCGNGQCDHICEHCETCPQDCGACPPPASCTCPDTDGDGHYGVYCHDSRCNPRDDCSPLNDTIYPGAPPSCTGSDNDCDGIGEWCEVCGNGDCTDRYGTEDCISCPADCGECPAPSCTCPDSDSDGYYDIYCSDSRCATRDDCNPASFWIHPGATEVCNGVDDDCDGWTDEDGCGSPGPVCGNGVCETGEDCSWCSWDCGSCPPTGPVCGNGACEIGEDCTWCSWDCTCPPADPGSSGEICGDEIDDNGNGDLWDDCECRPIYGQSTRCVDGRYVEGCNRGNWRRDQDCLTEAWGCPGNTGRCIFYRDFAGCTCP